MPNSLPDYQQQKDLSVLGEKETVDWADCLKLGILVSDISDEMEFVDPL